ncbi:MAG: phospho-N-acetylmuramoyl-pentapeptide-transferase [Clostridia bacterium]
MNDSIFIALAGFLTFFITMIVAPLVIMLMKRLKAGQVILGYVEQHSYKTGTPTIGGVMFVLPTIVVTMILGYSKLSLVAAAILFSYAVLGFLDDFIKIKHKQNLGLRAYQKVIGQFGIALIVAIFCFKNQFIGSAINVPFTDKIFEMQWWYIPFVIFIYIAVTNSVNLTDGLDGLATTVSIVYFLTFLIIILFQLKGFKYFGQAQEYAEMKGLAVFTACLIGGLLGFLWQNSYPAKIMMGDTGSLAIGGSVVTVAVFTKNPLIILTVGIMFVVSCISVVMQVIYFKLTKKRIFLMSPYHHHLEKKGCHESKIVAFYSIVTVLAAVIALISAGVI